jgi:hypothetical protein
MAIYFIPKDFAVAVGKRAKFPQNMKNKRQIQMKNIALPPCSVAFNVIMNANIAVH